ncbi:putative methylase [Streptococcus macacae NCTC 11558]|uniref:Ribosomal RNA small subunit methyltransferase I n=1 Tax=Streptococcus macacae NCTC 11558 TaxID=764298 RepID=G5JYE3_9STRE|nr:16S rRNA (cytidine(1402)-2'-O)-methyltransferase [Streptococcus macacae]EHJ51971.1 S-adenosylmethionine-dependent methyltransferase, YraL family [Streptococcus macacae NCTC 11558]SUN78056.1 putative methylase [Streptococcus macacae NCTC 11558]
MQVQKSFKDKRALGKLYLVPTPIGNLEDMTYRAVKILSKVDYICAEDTRNTGLLLKHFSVHAKQISFHQHNALEKIPYLLDLLRSGKSLAQVSDAGLPSISDPGYYLVEAAVKEDFSVVALPGASAGITALIASGLLPQPYAFYGFLPRKSGQQKSFFEEKKDYPETQIFYESPYRLKKTLENLLSVYGDRQAVVVRELTKIYEEYQRGTITELLDYLSQNPLKGECLFIVEGFHGQTDDLEVTSNDSSIKERINAYIAGGLKPNQAIKKVAKERHISRQEVYNLYHGLSG